MSVGPLAVRYDAAANSLRLTGRFAAIARERMTDGASYHVEPESPASARSRGHYFARLDEVWASLPEGEDRFPSREAMRHWALIKAGYCDQRSHVCASKAEAARTAAFIRPLDPFAIVAAREAVVTVYTAQSQSAKAMGGEVFQASKDAVLAIAEGLLADQRQAA